MCRRDNEKRKRKCSLCGEQYYGDLGHRNCPALKKADDSEEKTIILPEGFLKDFKEGN